MEATTGTAAGTPYSRVLEEIRGELSSRVSPRWDSATFSELLDLHDEALGLDSVGVIEFLLHCEQHFGVSLPESFLNAFDKTVGELAGVVVAATKTGEPS
jgi:acyl carrier protein